jgi:NAD(P)-dependent dehydrogenase (short-subunit alcohol dehydrogenase family)
MEIDFKNKVSLITGATSGIGEACAEIFARAGSQVMLTGRNADKLEALTNSIQNGDASIHFLAGDIADAHFRESLIKETIGKFGKLDVLINSAGIIGMGTIETTTLENFDQMMDINLYSIFHLSQLAIPHLEKTQGNIVNLSSVAGLRSFPGLVSYCVSKAAVDQLTRCTALELAPKNIRVNAVNPGVVVTNLHRRSGMPEESYQKFVEHSKTTHPIGRVGEPKEIAKLIAYLASDNSEWITGVTYSIDGGRAQTCFR